MAEQEAKSEVAQFRQRQVLEEEAMRLGMYGFAEVARHERITARMMRGAERVLCLIAEGKHEEAQAMMNREDWGEEGDVEEQTSQRGQASNEYGAASLREEQRV